MAQFDWPILVDAADLEVVLVLEIPHNKCLLTVVRNKKWNLFITKYDGASRDELNEPFPVLLR